MRLILGENDLTMQAGEAAEFDMVDGEQCSSKYLPQETVLKASVSSLVIAKPLSTAVRGRLRRFVVATAAFPRASLSPLPTAAGRVAR